MSRKFHLQVSIGGEGEGEGVGNKDSSDGCSAVCCGQGVREERKVGGTRKLSD